MTTDTVVRIDGLTKRYGDHEALRGVSFEIERGEVFALLGPNGAGKSTTIEILEGYRTRSGGEVRVLGVDPSTGGTAWKARLGIVVQSSAEGVVATVREEIAHFAALYPNPHDVDETIAAVGLSGAAKQRVRTLSGGERRRLDVAMGIIGRPELLFLDEPTTGFDPEARRQFWDLVTTLRDDGTTVLLTTHYLDEAAHLSDRVAVVAAGRLVDIGTAAQIGPAESRVPLVRWREGENMQEQRTDTPAEFVSALVSRIGEPDELEVVRPTLEDVYLTLIGAPDRNSGARSENHDHAISSILESA